MSSKLDLVFWCLLIVEIIELSWWAFSSKPQPLKNFPVIIGSVPFAGGLLILGALGSI